MDLLTNAVESIRAGLEDYRADTRPRLLSAVRNLHAGVLLLFKEALRRRSPPESDEVLVRARIEPRIGAGGAIRFVGVGKKTVNVHQIKRRFSSLGIATDWDAFDSITGVRNDVEHYYREVHQDAIKGLLSSAFLIVREFAAKELRQDPRELLGQEAWKAMLEIAGVYAAEKSESERALLSVEWGSDVVAEGVRELNCPNCGSGLLRPVRPDAGIEAGLSCRSCGKESDFEWYISKAVEVALADEAYVAMTDGADEPYGDCPECGLATYVVEYGACVYCGATPESTCARCHQTIPVSELQFSPLCGYCDHLMSKDD